jgi:hypothetical protein
MKTRAPSSTNFCAVATPIPLVPPVMTATLPSGRAISWSSNFVINGGRAHSASLACQLAQRPRNIRYCAITWDSYLLDMTGWRCSSTAAGERDALAQSVRLGRFRRRRPAEPSDSESGGLVGMPPSGWAGRPADESRTSRYSAARQSACLADPDRRRTRTLFVHTEVDDDSLTARAMYGSHRASDTRLRRVPRRALSTGSIQCRAQVFMQPRGGFSASNVVA